MTLSVLGSGRIIEEDPGQPRTASPLERSGESSAEKAGVKKAGGAAGLGFVELLKAAEGAAGHDVPTRAGSGESGQSTPARGDLPRSSSREVEQPGDPPALSRDRARSSTPMAPGHNSIGDIKMPPSTLTRPMRQPTAESTSTSTATEASSRPGRPVTQHASYLPAVTSSSRAAAGGPTGLAASTSTGVVVAPSGRDEPGAGSESLGRTADLLSPARSKGGSRAPEAPQSGLGDPPGESDRASPGVQSVPVSAAVDGATATRHGTGTSAALGERASPGEKAPESDAAVSRPMPAETAAVEIASHELHGGDGLAHSLPSRGLASTLEPGTEPRSSESQPVQSPSGTAKTTTPERLALVETPPTDATTLVSDRRSAGQLSLTGEAHARSKRAAEVDNLGSDGSAEGGGPALGVEAASAAGRGLVPRSPTAAAVGSEGSVAPGEIDGRVLHLVAPPAETKDGGWQTTVRLDPPDLGTIDATVTVRGGNVAVVLTYQTDSTHSALQAALHTIQSNLGDRATVSLADGRLAGGGGGGGGSSSEKGAGNSATGGPFSPDPDNHVLLQQYPSVTPRHGQVDVLA